MPNHDIHIKAICTLCGKTKSFWGDNMTEAAANLSESNWSDSLCPECRRPPQAVEKKYCAADVYDRLYAKGYPAGNPMLVLSTFAYDTDLHCLDLGCGQADIAPMFTDYTGVDVSSVAINRAEIKYPDATFYVADLAAPPAEVFDERFDLVLCCDVMEHIPTAMVNPVMRAIANMDAPKFAFGISCRDSDYKDHLNRSLHLTVWKPHWWLNLLDIHFSVLRFICNDDFLIVEATSDQKDIR